VYAQIPEVDHSGLVFGSTRLNDTASKRQIDKLMLQFCREELLAAGRADFRYASIEHWVFHDLRRTAATLMAKLKHPKDIVHMILNHAAGGGASRGRAMLDQIYIIHDYQEQRQQALQDLGNYVKRVVTEPPSA
jgi:integrase